MPDPPELPDPDAMSGSDVVVYDGRCNFCIAQVRNVHRLDVGGNRLSFLSLHDPRVGVRYSQFSHDDLMDQMYVIDRRGNAYGGSDAIKYLSRRLPILWPAMPILHLPGTARLWRWMYKEVAKRRYWWAGEKTCEADACSVHMK